MRDPKRIPEMMNIVYEVWVKYPDLRLGQMIECAHNLALNHCNGTPDVFMMEDEELLLGLQLLRDQNA